MIKKIAADQVCVGMYVHKLDAEWMAHPFMRTHFPVQNESVAQKIRQSGIQSLYIDTVRGCDLPTAPTAQEARQVSLQKTLAIAAQQPGMEKKCSVLEEIAQAQQVAREANQFMHRLMEDVRLGQQVEVEAVQPMAERMVRSVFRNKDALISLTRIKQKDHYTFQHSVSVAGLMITFARAEGLTEAAILDVAIGGLLHDIGKMRVPNEILNKPGRLDDREFRVMKTHVEYSRDILEVTPGINKNALDVAAQHHERYDGTGYPLGLKGDQLSEIGQMATIVDVYDALTSVRVYKGAWQPTEVMRKLVEWSPNHFPTALVHRFVRCLGIYPVGTLVELESGLIGLVVEQHEKNLLRPMVQIIYDLNKRAYTSERRLLDLECESSDKIRHAIDPDAYGIKLEAFLYPGRA